MRSRLNMRRGIMEQEKRINKATFSPVIPKMYEKVAIYCRVSTHNQEQLKSLSNQ